MPSCLRTTGAPECEPELPPAEEAPGPSGAATSPIVTSNDALLSMRSVETLIKLSNNNKTAEPSAPG